MTAPAYIPIPDTPSTPGLQRTPNIYPMLPMSPKSLLGKPCLSRFGLWFCCAAFRRAFTKRLVRSLFGAFELEPEPPNTTSI
jgi:hypothetical protein